MKIANIEDWGEHNPCMSHMDLRIPFEEYMRYEYSKPNLDWNEACSFYQDPETELRYIGFCEGAFFMCHHKDKTNETTNP